MLTKLTFGAVVIVAAALTTPASAAPLSLSGASTVAAEAGKAGVVVDANWRHRHRHRWWRWRYYDDDGWYYRRHHRHRWWRHHRHHRYYYD
jgi:hypothetical protein